MGRSDFQIFQYYAVCHENNPTTYFYVVAIFKIFAYSFFPLWNLNAKQITLYTRALSHLAFTNFFFCINKNK